MIDLDFDVELTGFALAEIDFLIDAAGDANPSGQDSDADHVPAIDGPATSRMGDIWTLGRHRLICGDARDPAAMAALMLGERVDMVFTDPPYNVAIDGNVCGLGSVKHREFAFASGDMSEGQFIAFLSDSLGTMAEDQRAIGTPFVG